MNEKHLSTEVLRKFGGQIMKKRYFIIILSVVTIISAICIIYKSNIYKQREQLSIIGSADGPTSILVSSSDDFFMTLIFLVIAIFLLIVFIISRKKKN